MSNDTITPYENITGSTANQRLQNYFAENKGQLNVDGLTACIGIMTLQYDYAEVTTRLISEGTFSTCEHDLSYTSNDPKHGSRIYTTQEASQNVLEAMDEIADRIAPTIVAVLTNKGQTVSSFLTILIAQAQMENLKEPLFVDLVEALTKFQRVEEFLRTNANGGYLQEEHSKACSVAIERAKELRSSK